MTVLLAVPLSTAWPAELSLEPYVAARVQHDTNVFQISDAVAEASGNARTADTVQRQTAGIDVDYALSQQDFAGSAEARRFAHSDFVELDRTEHSLTLGYGGRFLGSIRTLLELGEERRLAAFEDRRSTEAVLERERRIKGGINLSVTPTWHVLAGARQRDLSTPLPAALAVPSEGLPGRPASPDFGLEETAFAAGLQYGVESFDRPVEEAPLLFGLLFEHQRVRFRDLRTDAQDEAAAEPSQGYRILLLEATAQYVVSGMSRLQASLGATELKAREDSEAQPAILSGELSYRRELSAVTAVNVGVFRRFAPFVVSADTTTDTGWLLGLRWEPSLDLVVELDYTRTRSSFEGSAVAPEDAGRSDNLQSAGLSVRYPLFRLVDLRAFASYTERSSSRAFNDFNGSRVGAELSYRWQ